MPEMALSEAMAPDGVYLIKIENGLPVLHAIDDDSRCFSLPSKVPIGVQVDWVIRARFLANPHVTGDDRSRPLKCEFVPSDKGAEPKFCVIDERCCNFYRNKTFPLAALDARGKTYGLPHIQVVIETLH